MEISIKTRQAYSEIDEFINLLTDEEKNKIPKQLRKLFNEEKDKNYIKGINPKIPIQDQNLSDETLAIIALLNLQYWCEDEQEKERLKSIYSENEKIYQDTLREKFNPDNIFQNKNNNNHSENTQVVVYKESFVKKIIKKIFNFFNIKK